MDLSHLVHLYVLCFLEHRLVLLALSHLELLYDLYYLELLLVLLVLLHLWDLRHPVLQLNLLALSDL